MGTQGGIYTRIYTPPGYEAPGSLLFPVIPGYSRLFEAPGSLLFPLFPLFEAPGNLLFPVIPGYLRAHRVDGRRMRVLRAFSVPDRPTRGFTRALSDHLIFHARGRA